MPLQSKIVQGADAESEDSNYAPVEGIYGTKGFYFQQRRGRLDLRALAQVDLEHVVRNVDVEPLQAILENLTFCNLKEEDLRFITDQHVVKLFRSAQLVLEYLLYAQEQLSNNVHNLAMKYASKKRSLMKKRTEVIELRETSKQLKMQLKSKKRGIETLEEMLKEASKNNSVAKPRHNRRHHRKEKSDRESEDEQQPRAVPPSSGILKYFVCGPDGICVEFTSKPSTTIRELRRDVHNTLGPMKEDTDGNKDIQFKLMLNGRILPEDLTLFENGIKSGDTLIAITDRVAKVPSNKHSDVNDMMKTLQDSMREMTTEMRFVRLFLFLIINECICYSLHCVERIIVIVRYSLLILFVTF